MKEYWYSRFQAGICAENLLQKCLFWMVFLLKITILIVLFK